ncbi:MAG: 16S rRNA processing protein RimM [Porphyromonadaceae bacterium]|nr:16S rRNA processing protein RimM [Porphyromonadaceae bacterium]
MIRKEDYLHIGHTGRAHGLSGELACKLTVDIKDWIEDEEGRAFLMLEQDGLLIPFRIESHRTKSEEVDLIKFAGISSKEEAERWGNTPVWLIKDVMADMVEDSPLDDFALFLGYEVYARDTSRFLGEIVHVDETTMNTLITVQSVERGELLLPLAGELISSVDEQARRLVLIIPDGLLTDDAPYDIH